MDVNRKPSIAGLWTLWSLTSAHTLYWRNRWIRTKHYGQVVALWICYANQRLVNWIRHHLTSMAGVYRPTKSLFSSLLLGLFSLYSGFSSTTGKLHRIRTIFIHLGYGYVHNVSIIHSRILFRVIDLVLVSDLVSGVKPVYWLRIWERSRIRHWKLDRCWDCIVE